MTDIFQEVEKEAASGQAKKRTFAGFKNQLRFNDGQISTNCEVRYAKLDVEPAFSAEAVEKLGPHGGKIRYSRGEWKTFEQMPDGSEMEISDDEIKYFQSGSEVSPFDATKTWDINPARQIDECTLDGATSLGTLIPIENIDTFGPDKDRGSSLYWIAGDAFALKALIEKLEKERLALYFPHVFRKGLTIHLAVAYIVRLDGKVYLAMKTFGGSTIWSHPLVETGTTTTVGKKIAVLAKPVLRRKQTQGSL